MTIALIYKMIVLINISMRAKEIFEKSKDMIILGKKGLDEVAPESAEAERFIKKNKKEFKKRYGKRGEEVLYATAWKKFRK